MLRGFVALLNHVENADNTDACPQQVANSQVIHK